MNIIVLSDTHGKLEAAMRLVARISSFAKVDMIIHCGDFVSDAVAIREQTGIKTISVPGNCDGSFERRFELVEIPSGRLLVTHGHTEGVKHGLMQLMYLAQEQGCNAVCYGHTHVALIEEIDGIRFINPGSASRPRDCDSCSCALLNSNDKHLVATIIRDE